MQKLENIFFIMHVWKMPYNVTLLHGENGWLFTPWYYFVEHYDSVRERCDSVIPHTLSSRWFHIRTLCRWWRCNRVWMIHGSVTNLQFKSSRNLFFLEIKKL